MSRLLVLFPTAHTVIKAERLCISENVPCKVIAVPRQISSECGIALELEDEQETVVQKLLTRGEIPFEMRRLEK